ncbi:hypothetical protein AUJ14_05600 [Candidatus Micrarchaeota archaeon CG1_02_55_22]|nr:MAG: hypothetical protein AUJ14_05600 [Candidatus Micrarchaeota archaeon CG1_02_55_22]
MPETADFKLETDGPEDEPAPEQPEPLEGEIEESEGESTTIEETAPDEVLERSTAQKQAVLPLLRNKDMLRVIEAALFLGNRAMTYPELAVIAKTSVRKAKNLAEKLAEEYAERENAVEVFTDAKQVTMQVRPSYLADVSTLSKNVELSRKSTRILGLVAKKGKLLQSELKKYFRGDIYGYITELKEQGYIISEKAGNTRLLRVTSKFAETFQWNAPATAPEAPLESASETKTD